MTQGFIHEILADSKLFNDLTKKRLQEVLELIPRDVLMELSGRVIVTEMSYSKFLGHTFRTKMTYSEKPARFIIVLNIENLRVKKARYVIGHELAHAYLDLHDKTRRPEPKELHTYKEDETDGLTESWGLVTPRGRAYARAKKIQEREDKVLIQYMRNRPHLHDEIIKNSEEQA